MSAIIGGDPHGRNDALVDTTAAVLLDTVNVVAVATLTREGAGRAIGLELAGRVNRSRERSSTLYLFDADGAAAIISELLGLAGRASPGFLHDLLRRIDRLP